MNSYKQDLITYRIERADALLKTAKNLIDDQDWFSAANRLYYAVYQIISALLTTSEDILIKSHAGAKAMFELHFVKTGRVEIKWSNLYSRLSRALAMIAIMGRSLRLQKKIFSLYIPRPKCLFQSSKLLSTHVNDASTVFHTR